MADVFDFYVRDNRKITFDIAEPIMREDSGVTDFRFHIPKTINGLDMSDWAWWFVFVNANKEKYSIALTLSDDPESPLENNLATYTVDYAMSIKAGAVQFALEAINAGTGGTIDNEWHTLTYETKVKETLQGNQAEYAETESDIISALLEEVRTKMNQVIGGATPTPVKYKAQMTDPNAVYLYVGSEPNEYAGHWYYHNGTTFVSGGVYGAGVVDSVPTQGSTNAVQSGGVYEALAGKVDAETGKGLSTNDYSDAEKQKVTDAAADLSAMTTATAEDVGKALKAKTVSDGKVTEWEFGEAGGEDISAITDTIPEYLKASDVTGTYQWYADAEGTIVTTTTINACTFGTVIPIEAGKLYYYKDIIAGKSWYRYANETSGRIVDTMDNDLHNGTFTATADGTVICSGLTANASTAIWTEDEGIYNAGLQQDKIILKTDSTLTDAELPANSKTVGDRIGIVETELDSLGDVAETVKAVSEVTEKVEPINLVDPSKVTVGYLGQDCTLHANTGRITDFIKVDPNTEYTANNLTFGDSSVWVSWMFESADLSSKISKVPSATFTTPNNCNYVRLVYISDAKVNSAMLVESDALPSQYIAYHDPYYVLSADGLKPALDYADAKIKKVIEVENNNYWDATFGRCGVDATTHTITKNESGMMRGSGYFRIHPNVTYYTNRLWSLPHSYVYDKDMNFVCEIGNSSDCITVQHIYTHQILFTVFNPNAYYCILTGTNGGLDVDGVIIKVFADDGIAVNFEPETALAIKSRISSVSPYMFGKKWAVLGDSITAGDGLTANIITRYSSVVAKQCGIIPYNYGYSGSRIATEGSPGDSTYDNAMVIRYANMIADADYITVLGGINDANNQLPLGTLGNTDISTFYGALEVLITGLLTKYPGKSIGFITYPHYQGSERHRTYANAIKEACARYAIPVLDLHSIGGMNTMTTEFSQMFYSDGLHPNELGQAVMAHKICAFLGTL